MTECATLFNKPPSLYTLVTRTLPVDTLSLSLVILKDGDSRQDWVVRRLVQIYKRNIYKKITIYSFVGILRGFLDIKVFKIHYNTLTQNICKVH